MPTPSPSGAEVSGDRDLPTGADSENRHHDLHRTALRGIGWTVARSVSSRLVGSAVFVVLARTLDPTDFGTVALASVFVVLISVLVESGFAEAIIQRDKVTPTDLNSAFWVNNAVGLALAVVMVGSAPLVATPLGQPQLAPVLQVLSTVFVLAALSSVPQAFLRRDLAFRAIALRGFAATVTGGAVGVAMAFAGAGVWSLVGQMVANALAGTVILWAMCPWRPGRSVSATSVRQLLSFSARITGERLALFVGRRSDDFLIGVVLGPVALGLYTVAYRVLLILTEIIIWTLEGVAFPLLSRLQNDPERRRRAFYALTGLSWAVAVPCFLLLAILAPEVTRLAFGTRWSGAVPVMQALALVGIPHSLVYCNKAAINASGRPEVSLRLALLTCLVSVVGFAVVVRWGILAVAVSYTVSGYLLALVSVAMVIRVMGLDTRTYLRRLVAPLVSGLLMIVAVLSVKASLSDGAADLVTLAVCLTVAGLVYLAVLCLTAWSQVRALAALARRPTRS